MASLAVVPAHTIFAMPVAFHLPVRNHPISNHLTLRSPPVAIPRTRADFSLSVAKMTEQEDSHV